MLMNKAINRQTHTNKQTVTQRKRKGSNNMLEEHSNGFLIALQNIKD